MKLGLNIRDVRKRRGLTLDELSGLCGIGRDELGAYELGKVSPRAETVRKIADALQVPITAIHDGMGWADPQSEEGWERSMDDSLLFDGIIENLKESYGNVDCGEGQSGIFVGSAQDGFLLDETDIRALIQSVKASIPALIEYMKDTRPEEVINSEILKELDIAREDGSEELLIRQYALTDEQWEQLRDLLPPERTGKGRPFKSNRLMLDGILFWMKSGVAWKKLPGRFGRYKCVMERLQLWRSLGVWQPLVEKMAQMGIVSGESADACQ